MSRALDILRVLLGAALVVTALDYFLPALVPAIGQPAWNDPMAARLMTAFDRSGLLAIAKFIHLIAGLLLLANRAVPFALAALLPVNLCGLFISLFIEAEAPIAVLAVVTVALNALLMLACLPAYRRVLEGGDRRTARGRKRDGTTKACSSIRSARLRPRPISAAAPCSPRRSRSIGSSCRSPTARPDW